jgi:hypothetical protein
MLLPALEALHEPQQSLLPTVGAAHDSTSWLQENRPKKPEKKVTYLFIPGDSFVNKI